MAGGTGDKFEAATTVIAGVASLAATLLSILYDFSHVANLYQYSLSHLLIALSVD